MLDELKESWIAHERSTSQDTATSSKLNEDTLHAIQKSVSTSRREVEGFALDALNQVSSMNSHWHNHAHDMLRTVGLVPTATTQDLAKIALDESLIDDFNPMLPQDACKKLVESIIVWLQLCVFDDKIARLCSLYMRLTQTC